MKKLIDKYENQDEIVEEFLKQCNNYGVERN